MWFKFLQRRAIWHKLWRPANLIDTKGKLSQNIEKSHIEKAGTRAIDTLRVKEQHLQVVLSLVCGSWGKNE